MAEGTPRPDVAKFERLINEIIKKNLLNGFQKLDAMEEELVNIERTEINISTMEDLAEDNPPNTRVNIGCDFFMEARPDASKYLVCIGLDCYLEFTPDEAQTYLRHRASKLKKRAAEVREKNAQLRAQLTMALHCIQQIEGL